MKVDIIKIKRRLLVKYPLFGSVIVNLDYIENKNCKTLQTDGKRVYYNSDFIETLTEDEQTFLFAHEICHVAFNHIYRSENKDKKIWNIAADAVINAFLQKDGLPLVNGAVNIPNAINYNVEKLYEKLLKEKLSSKMQNLGENFNNLNNNANTKQLEIENKENKNNEEIDMNKRKVNFSKNKQTIKDNNLNETKDTSQTDIKENFSKVEENENKRKINENSLENYDYDTHSMWQQAVEKMKQDIIEKESNKGSTNKNIEKEIEQIDEEKMGQRQIDKSLNESTKEISDIEEIDAFVKNTIKREKNLEELQKDILEKSMAKESATISANRKIINIGNAKSVIDWRYLLKEAINLNIDWSYKNATIENGVVTPHLEEFEKPQTEILLDTSGSIDEDLLKKFLRECKNILKTSTLKVGCFDTKFYGFKEIYKSEDIENMQFIGHGGTNFYVAVKAFSSRVENKIIFTDGRGLIPSKTSNIIWILFGNERININCGKVIYMNN